MIDRALQARDVGAWESQAIDIRGCAQLEIAVSLYAHERAGLRFETWPDVVRRDVLAVVETWSAKNPDRMLRRFATGVEAGVCVAIIHHAPREAPAVSDPTPAVPPPQADQEAAGVGS